MNVGSLFAGIGGLDLGLERAGFTVRWQVERNPFCLAVLTKHWPDVPRYTDVCAVRGSDLEPVDLIAGGFPCQDVSDAGKREGIDGARSGLWTEFARIICEMRARHGKPNFVLVENVRGLLVRGMDRVLGDLAGLGFDAEWGVLRASDVRSPHRRARVFIVAYAASSRQAPWTRASDHGEARRERAQSGVEPAGRRRANRLEHPDVPRQGDSRERDARRERDAGRDAAAGAGRAGLADAEHEGRGQRETSLDDDRRDASGHYVDRRRSDDPRPDWLGDVVSARSVADAAGLRRTGGDGQADLDAAGSGDSRMAIPDAVRRERGTNDEGESAAGREWTASAGRWIGWPARPGEVQAWWEPPRVLRRAQSGVGVDPDGLPAGLVRHRRRALEALGNAVVPQVGEVLGWHLRALAERWEAIEADPSGSHATDRVAADSVTLEPS